jgi:hypothetical protein
VHRPSTDKDAGDGDSRPTRATRNPLRAEPPIGRDADSTDDDVPAATDVRAKLGDRTPAGADAKQADTPGQDIAASRPGQGTREGRGRGNHRRPWRHRRHRRHRCRLCGRQSGGRAFPWALRPGRGDLWDREPVRPRRQRAERRRVAYGKHAARDHETGESDEKDQADRHTRASSARLLRSDPLDSGSRPGGDRRRRNRGRPKRRSLSYWRKERLPRSIGQVRAGNRSELGRDKSKLGRDRLEWRQHVGLKFCPPQLLPASPTRAGGTAATLRGRLERCPSGLRSATGNRVRAERCVAGSNPALSVRTGPPGPVRV